MAIIDRGRAGVRLPPALTARADDWAWLRRTLPHQSALFMLVDPDAPSADAVLAGRGARKADFNRWARALPVDPLLMRACTAGRSERDADASSDAPPAAGINARHHTTVITTPAMPCPRRWVLALGTRKPLTEHQARLAGCVLHLFRVRFDAIDPREAGLSRLLTDPTGRLVALDPASCMADGGPPRMQALAQQAIAVAAQRWPMRPAGRPLDLVLDDGGRPTWVRVLFARPFASAARPVVSIELRPADRDDPPPIGLVDDPRVAEALGYLADRVDQPPSLDALAGHLGVSAFHFHRLFVQQAGVSPKHLMLRLQLMHAKWWLRTTATPVGEIAARCGFASHGHFAATFARLVGQSPSDYRATPADAR